VLLDEIKGMPWYRGQALEDAELPSGKAIHGDLFSSGFLNLTSLTQDVVHGLGSEKQGAYRHQTEVLSHFSQGENCLLCAPAGSGRRTTIALAAISVNALSGHSALIFVPRPNMVKDLVQQVNDVARAGGVSPACIVDGITSNTAFDAAISKGSGVYITTPIQFMHDLSLRAGDIVLRSLLDDIRLCGATALTLYRPGELAHLSALLRFLRARSPLSQFILTSLPLRSPERLSASLLSSHAFVVSEDGSPKNSAEHTHWFPPLSANEDKEEGSYLIRREKASDEVVEVASEIVRSMSIRRLLLWHGIGPLPRDRILEIRSRLSDKLQRYGVEESERLDLVVVENLEEILSDAFRSFDLVLCLGHPGRLDSHHSQLGNLCRDGGLVLQVVPEDPDAFALMQYPALKEHMPGAPDLVVPATERVDTDYLHLFMQLSTGETVTAAQLRVITRDNERRIDELEELGSIIALQNDSFIIVNAPGNNVEQWSWERIADEALTLHTEEGEPCLIDRFRIPFSAHDGGVYYTEGTAYHLNLKENTLIRATSNHPVLTIPDLDLSFTSETTIIPDRQLSFGDRAVSVRFQEGQLSIRENGYHLLKDLSASESGNYVGLSEPLHHAQRAVPALVIETAVPSELAVFLGIRFRSEFIHPEEVLAIFPNESGGTVIAALHDSFLPLMKDLWNRLPILLPNVFSYAYEILKTCACTSGCRRCLKPLLRRWFGDTSKESAFLEFGALLEREETATEWDYKSKGLPAAEVATRYLNERNLIVPIYRDRFDMAIGLISSVSPVADLGGSAGVYMHDSETGSQYINILAPMPQATAIQVVAHELAHNWQFDPTGPNLCAEVIEDSLPHEGKMISEGFAQWASFKICDHRALHDEAASIRMWVDDEYGDGFDFMNWLEYKYGFKSVMDLVQNGYIQTSAGQVACLELIAERDGNSAKPTPGK